MLKEFKTIAIHLPQFHPTPENDAWWGTGFTEWRNVVQARPLFKGHYQPHLPADLGFYDLRLEEARSAQATLAKEHGIHGFCYYHYWFNGRRLLHEPLDGILKTKKPDFPFMLCWANENWTRRWDGGDNEILIKQDYSAEDDINHIRFLLESFFRDDRYIKVDSKPFILIYRPQLFPDIQKTLQLWRDEATAFGFSGLYIGFMQTFGFQADPTELGFDCAVEFQPDFNSFPPPEMPSLKEKILHKAGIEDSVHYNHKVFSFEKYTEIAKNDKSTNPNIYKSVTPMWDNHARRKKGAYIMHGSTPDIYKDWLGWAAEKTANSTNSNKFLFINAWNEWAEGNHLEPCIKWGRRYLQATSAVLNNYVQK